MTGRSAALPPLSPFLRRVLAAPILTKTVGIGALVGVVFGCVTLLQVHGTLARVLHEMLERRALASAHSLVAQVERAMATTDYLTVRATLRRHRERFSDIRYIVARDRSGRIVASTFDHGVPSDLQALHAAAPGTPEGVTVVDTRDGLVFDAWCSILDGHGGVLRLGVSEREIAAARGAVTAAHLWALTFAASAGIGLAYVLAYLLAGPIGRLAGAADRIRDGDFAVRARVEWEDEIGRLAAAFNRMAEHLEQSRAAVENKERARMALIDKLIQTQEEERKTLGLELHDHVGQSLLAVTMMIEGHEAAPGRGESDAAFTAALKPRLLALIDEVRQLAWGMRPSILDDFGLDATLSRHIATLTRPGLEIDYQYSATPGLERLPARIEVTLYRIAQEALANVIRHSQAPHASVVVLHSHREVSLIVEDAGKGFSARAPAVGERMTLGLAGMRERASLLGGDCSIQSAPERGTTVRVRIPLVSGEAPCPCAS